MNSTKQIAKSVFWLLSGSAFNGLLAFLLTIYVARVLGAASFGLYNFAQAFLIYLLLIVDSGLSILGAREIAREREAAAQISVNILAVRTMLAFAVFILTTTVLVFLPIGFQLRLLFIGTFLFVFCRALSTDWLFQGIEKMEYISLSKILLTFATFILVIIFIKNPGDLVRLPLINAFCGIGIALTFIWFLFAKIFRGHSLILNPSTWTHYFMSALPLGASMIMIQIYGNLDTIMLGFYDQPAVVGYYSAAYKIYFVLIGLYVTWQTTCIPTINRKMKQSLAEAEIFINKYAKLTLLAFIPAAIAVFLLSPQIVRVVFGMEYASANLALRILLITFMSVLIGSCYVNFWMVPAGRFNDFLIAVGVGAGSNIILNIILIPKYSLYGAAWATVMAEIMAMLVAFCLAQKVKRINLFGYYFMPILLSALALLPYLLAVSLTNAWPLIIKTVINFVVYLGSYALLLLIFERKFIMQFIKELSQK